MAGLSAEEFAAWVAASCQRSGVAVKVTDPASVRRVAVLLSGRAGAQPAAAGRSGSDAPGDVDAVRVESLPASLCGGVDGDVVDERSNDRDLAS